MKAHGLAIALSLFALTACDRKEWESQPGRPGTEELFKHHPVEGDGHEEHAEKGQGKEGEKAH